MNLDSSQMSFKNYGKTQNEYTLELIDDIIAEYPDTKEYMQQELQEKCKKRRNTNRHGNFYFLESFQK